MLVRNNGTTRWFARSRLVGSATGSSCVSEIRATSGWRAPSLRAGANCSSTVVAVITWKATSRICIATMPYAPAPCAHLCLRLPGTRPCSATSGLVLCMRAQNASSLCETCTADRWFAARGLWLVTFGLRPMAPAASRLPLPASRLPLAPLTNPPSSHDDDDAAVAAAPAPPPPPPPPRMRAQWHTPNLVFSSDCRSRSDTETAARLVRTLRRSGGLHRQHVFLRLLLAVC